MTKYEKEQEKLKRWFEKDFFWVYKRTCSVCEAEFYTHNLNDTVCHHGECDMNRKGKRNITQKKDDTICVPTGKADDRQEEREAVYGEIKGDDDNDR